MTKFRKTGECPASPHLLAYQRGELCSSSSHDIAAHLQSCEFCFAEVEFYSHYPQRDESIKAEPIPAPLYDLARALLRRGYDGIRWIDSILHITSSPKNN